MIQSICKPSRMSVYGSGGDPVGTAYGSVNGGVWVATTVGAVLIVL